MRGDAYNQNIFVTRRYIPAASDLVCFNTQKFRPKNAFS